MPLGSAMFLGSFEATKVILSYRDYHEYFVHDPDKHPVNSAVENGNQRCLELVLNHGFSPNNVTSSGETALRTAIEKGRFDLCELLLQHGADPDLTPEGNRTPLIQAIFEGDLGMVKLLVDHKATIDKREMPPDAGWSRTPSLFYQVETGDHILTTHSAHSC
jgi:ankyrin repeat protein